MLSPAEIQQIQQLAREVHNRRPVREVNDPEKEKDLFKKCVEEVMLYLGYTTRTDEFDQKRGRFKPSKDFSQVMRAFSRSAHKMKKMRSLVSPTPPEGVGVGKLRFSAHLFEGVLPNRNV